MVGAEPAKHQQRRRNESNRQRENQNERNKQPDSFGHDAESYLPADEWLENFFDDTPEQKHKREHRHGERKRRQHLPRQIYVQSFHFGNSRHDRERNLDFEFLNL